MHRPGHLGAGESELTFLRRPRTRCMCFLALRSTAASLLSEFLRGAKRSSSVVRSSDSPSSAGGRGAVASRGSEQHDLGSTVSSSSTVLSRFSTRRRPPLRSPSGEVTVRYRLRWCAKWSEVKEGSWW